MMSKIDLCKYETVDDFLQDIELICSNALEYNPDHTMYGRALRHRACALRDLAKASIEQELEKDFEKLCEQIKKARKQRGNYVMSFRLRDNDVMLFRLRGNDVMSFRQRGNDVMSFRLPGNDVMSLRLRGDDVMYVVFTYETWSVTAQILITYMKYAFMYVISICAVNSLVFCTKQHCAAATSYTDSHTLQRQRLIDE